MRDSPDTADTELADVYSLAKTLWVLLSGSSLPLPGQHRADDDMCRLTVRLDDPAAPHLDLLIERCTANDPHRRPRMQVVADELDAMLNPTVKRAGVLIDTSVLEERIATNIATDLRRQQQLAEYERQVVHGQSQLERIVDKTYQELSRRLPGFGAVHRSPPQLELPPDVIHAPAPHGRSVSARDLIAPGNAGARLTVGLMLQVHDYATGRSTIVAAAQVNRHNRGRGQTAHVATQRYETTVPSAHFENIVTQVDHQLHAAIPNILAKVAEFLDAERTSTLGSADVQGPTTEDAQLR